MDPSRTTHGPRRGPVRWVWLVVVAVVLAAVVVVVRGGEDRTEPTAAAPPVGSGLQMGVTVFALWRDWDRLDELLDRARDSGSPWLRVDVGWCTLEEEGPGEVAPWYEHRLDTVVAGARERGLQLSVMVACTPVWAGGTTAHPFPDDPAEFQRVMAWLADRYRGQVQAWEIWNEPDCLPVCGQGSPEDYVPVLQAGARGVRSADPAAVVVGGGTSGNAVDWLARMYDAGARGSFDALAVHPYLDPVTAPPDAPSEGMVYRLTTVAAVHDLMVERGDGDLPIWFTEMGWTTAADGARPGVDEATQARYLTEAADLISQRYPYVQRAFWFCLRDRDDWTSYENNFGLLTVDGAEKPAYAALQQANEALAAR